jgi:hypothetical protein
VSRPPAPAVACSASKPVAKLGALDEVSDSINAADFCEGAWNTNVVDGKTVGVLEVDLDLPMPGVAWSA